MLALPHALSRVVGIIAATNAKAQELPFIFLSKLFHDLELGVH